MMNKVHNIGELKAGCSELECYHMGTAEELARKFAPRVGGKIYKSLAALVNALNKGVDSWTQNHFTYFG